MRKLMMTLTALSAILFVTITTGCRTLLVDTPALPPKPERSPLEMPHSVKEYAQIIAYYETLVREWELWGETVEKTVIGEQAQEDKKH